VDAGSILLLEQMLLLATTAFTLFLIAYILFVFARLGWRAIQRRRRAG
jgi:hypothetical protein